MADELCTELGRVLEQFKPDLPVRKVVYSAEDATEALGASTKLVYEEVND